MDTGSTIVAPATPMAPAARGLVRVSGQHTFDTVDAIATSPIKRTRGVGPIRLRISSGQLPALAICLPGPASYTGEDTVEILPPGSPTIIDLVVRALLEQPGVRHAQAGEFSARAYLNGRLTLEQAEGVAATIAASTRQQLDASHRLLTGQSGRRYASIVDDMAGALALVEAAADFAEEEHVIPISAGDLRARLDGALDSLRAESEGRRGRESNAARPLVVLAGPPNAGKTSLFNALLGHRRAVVSPDEHTTRDAIVEPLVIEHPTIGAVSCDLADLPGLPDRAGVRLEPTEQDSIQAIIDDTIARADLVLLCDPHGRFDAPSVGDATLRLRTKADSMLMGPSGDRMVSVHSGLNLDAVRLDIARAIDAARQDSQAGLIPRHRTLAGRAILGLERAHAALGDDPAGALPEHGELIAAEMRLALDALAELGGHVHPDEILGRIFASFCVGK